MKPTVPVLTAAIAIAFGAGTASSPAQEAAGTGSKPTFEIPGSGYTLHYAPPWTKSETPANAMSPGALVYTPAGDGMVPVEAKLYFFGGGQGGTAEANLTRWTNQFVDDADRKSSTEELTFGDTKVTLLTVTGTYLDGPPMAPPQAKTKKPGSMLLGAILPGDDGPVFIKLTGPEKSVTAAEAAFKDLVASAFPQ